MKGYKWFGLARNMGTPREIRVAEKSIERISAQMTPEQIEQAKTDIDDWKPTPAKCLSRGIYLVKR